MVISIMCKNSEQEYSCQAFKERLLFKIKFLMHNCFMKHPVSLKNSCFHNPAPYCYQRVPVGKMWTKPLQIIYKITLDFVTVLSLLSGKSTTSLSETLTQTLTILKMSKLFFGKLITLVSFNDVTSITKCFLFRVNFGQLGSTKKQ